MILAELWQKIKYIHSPVLSLAFRTAFIITLTITSSACANGAAKPTAIQLDGTWRLISVDSKPLNQKNSGQIPFFTIAGNRINGFDGCNHFSGTLDSPGNVVSTRRGCLDDVIWLPLDLNNVTAHLQTAKQVGQAALSIPANGAFPESTFERLE